MILPWVDFLTIFVLVFMLGKLDEGVTINAVDGADNSAPTRKMPCQSDMFLAYSTVPGEILLTP